MWCTIAVAAATIAAVVLFLAGHSYALYDDAYIYFTYADHVVGGCGLRFRCDEAPVEGFTSPAYQLILVAARPKLASYSSLRARSVRQSMALASSLSRSCDCCA